VIEIYASGCKIAVKGHAGFAPVGQDIVCAGVSTLYGTYLYSVNAQETTEGEWKVLKAEPTYNNRAVFNAMRTGFEMLQEHFPTFVKVVSAYPAQDKKESV